MSTAIRQEATVGHVTSEQVWRAVGKASFAVLSYVTPSGEPRSSGVVYKVLDRLCTWRSNPAGGRPRTSTRQVASR